LKRCNAEPEDLILLLVLAAETVKGIKFFKELLVIIVSCKEFIEGDEAKIVLVDDSHELVSLLLDVSLLVRSELDLLGASGFAALLKDGSLENLTKGLLGELTSALAVSKSKGSSELGLLISDTNAHEEKELGEVHLAGLLAAKQTPDVFVHFALLLVSVAFLVEEFVPMELVDEALRIVLAHLLESALDLFVGFTVEAKTHLSGAGKIVLIKRGEYTVLCAHL